MYRAETWVLMNADENTLNIWERKIFGPVQDAGIWRITTNKELYISYLIWSQNLREHDSDGWAMLRECQPVE
jgi:hypothetical protein